jgi:hypothetical protein
MPYIKEEDRNLIADTLDLEPSNFGMIANSSGELNYIITTIVEAYINQNPNHKMNYSRINDAIGALECCKLELYRRLAAPYEDKKIKENGDVY